jgi:hypothetical protein
MPMIQHHHLMNWAPVASDKFGELLGKLIWATSIKQNPQVNFHAGLANNMPGWDGRVELAVEKTGGLHRSVWEISVREDWEAKFRQDSEDALTKALPEGWTKQSTTLVFATLRAKISASKRKSLIAEFRREHSRRWQQIQIVDVDDLVQWIDRVPQVEAWLAHEARIGKGQFGVSLEHAWKSWSNETTPPVSEDLVIAGRKIGDLCDKLRQTNAEAFSIQADSPEEAVALIYAAISTLPNDQRDAVLSSAMVVPDAMLADSLAIHEIQPGSCPLTILLPPAAKKKRNLLLTGHRVFLAAGNDVTKEAELPFDRATSPEFQKALVNMGVDPAEAEAQARACGCSVSVWQIYKLHESGISPTSLPLWTRPEHAGNVVPAVFLGGWNSISEPDKIAISRISTLPSSDFQAAIQQFGQCDNPLFDVIPPDWLVVAPTAAFAMVARNVTSVHLQHLKDACQSAFGEVTPEVEAHWAGQRAGPRHRNSAELHSDLLLDGLAETLLRIAVLGKPLVNSGALVPFGNSPQTFVDRVIGDFPGLAKDPRVMASRRNQLPYLAEAAPDPFLDALESLLQGDANDLKRWLNDEPGIFSTVFHAGLLWSLELLAWSEDYLRRVAHILSRFAELDPGGQVSNRPINSLREIFLAWHPQTFAFPLARIDVLRELTATDSQSSWQLLLELMPGKHLSAHQTSRPKWRSFGGPFERNVTVEELTQSFEGYVELAFKAAHGKADRLAELLPSYPNFLPMHKTRLINELQQLHSEEPDSNTVVRQALRNLIARHRSFPGATWALEGSELDRLETIAAQFESPDPVVRNRWLFDAQMPESGRILEDPEQWERDIRELRVSALTEILGTVGWGGIDRLISVVQFPYLVGELAPDLADSDDDLLLRLENWRLTGSIKFEIALRTASSCRFKISGDEWTTALLAFAHNQKWLPATVALALLDYPDSLQTFHTIEAAGQEVEREYWKRRWNHLRIEPSNSAPLSFATDKFLQQRRAIELLEGNLPRLKAIGPEIVQKVLEQAVDELQESKPSLRLPMIAYHLQEAFKWLGEKSKTSQVELAKLEYQVLPLLITHGGRRETLSLHKLLAADPGFFIDILSDLYSPASSKEIKQSATDEQAKAKAHAAFDLLQSWKTPPPGVNQDGIVERRLLFDWTECAISAAKSCDRLRIASQQIGRVLFYLPIDPDDGAWPHKQLRDLLEHLRNTDVETGLKLEAFNSRGVFSRAMFEGGSQERELEEKYRQYAKAIGTKAKRAMKLNLSIAEMWRNQALDADKEVRRRKIEVSR